jgi:hypothetical protein
MGLIPIGYALTGWALFEHDQSLNSGILRTCLDLPWSQRSWSCQWLTQLVPRDACGIIRSQ